MLAMTKFMAKLSVMQIAQGRYAYGNVSDGVAYGNVSDGKAKDIANDMTNDTANGLVKVKITSKTIPYIIAVT